MRILLSIMFTAGVASAQCYVFTGTGVSYKINVNSIVGQSNTSTASVFTTQVTESLTVGGTTYTGTNDPAAFDIASFPDVTIMTGGGGNPVGSPIWSAGVNLSGGGNLLALGVLPNSLPPVSSWVTSSGGMATMVTSIGGMTAVYQLTSITSCTVVTSSVSGKTLGDATFEVGCVACGAPINIATGNMFEQIGDYHTMGANELAFTRYYNSMSVGTTFATTFGSNWRSNYDRYLEISPTSVIAERANGQQVTFTQSGAAWVADSDVDLTLVNSGSTWTLTDHADAVETYSAVSATEGLLQSIKARNGYTRNLQYNFANQLIQVADSYNRQLSLTYNNGLLQTVSTPDGLILTYGYSSAGQLTSVGYSTTPATGIAYVYENSAFPHALTGVIDENGARYTTWAYDSTGRALSSQHSGGADLFSVSYDDTDGSRTVTGPLGQPAVYHFTTLQNVPKVSEIDYIATAATPASKETFSYDSNGYISSRTDRNGNVTNIVNEARGLPTSIVEAAGTAQARTTAITYHPTFRLPVQIVQPTLTANFTYDAAGEMLTLTSTDTSTTSTPYATNGQSRTWTFTWANSLLASAKGPRTDVFSLTAFTYDSSSALTSITNALNQVVHLTQHLPGGLPLTVVDANNVTTTFTYDARQRLLTSTVGTAAGPRTTTLAYDAAGNLVTATRPDGSAYNNGFDGAHRLASVVDLLNQRISYTRNAQGEPVSITFKDGAGNSRYQRSAAYDALGKLIQTIGGAGQTGSYIRDANGNITSATDGLSHAIQKSYDALNRLVTSTDAAQGVTSFGYDALSRPVSVTDPKGATTQYTYNGFGQPIQESSPSGGITVFHYDAAGNLTQRTDPRGVVANYAYDALNRLTSIAYPGNAAENVTISYDQNAFGVGWLTSVADAPGTLSRTYDERGNLLSETRAQGAATLQTSYSYDAASRVVSTTYPSHWSVAFTRDSMGRITAAAATPTAGPSKPLFSAVGYQPFGPLNAITYGNGVAETRSFDADYRLTGIAATVENLVYGYDAANNVLSIADGINASNTQSFSYDALNRVSSAAGAYGQLGYGYDANGNRVSETSSASGDGLGTVSSLTYNQAGRLATVSSGSQQLTQYMYDAFGRRIVKVGSTTATTHYQYAFDGSLLEESDAQGNPQVDYMYLNGRPIATIQADGSVHYLHDDRLGTPLAATDSGGTVVWSTTYQPFGQISSVPTVIAQDLRLPGQEADVETGLNHNGFRNYIPGLGRYLETDPIGLRGGTNRYAYADGNPIGVTDRLGLDGDGSWNLAGIYDNKVNALNYQTLPEPVLPAAPPPAPPPSSDPLLVNGKPTTYGGNLMMCIGGTRVTDGVAGCDPSVIPAVQMERLNEIDNSFTDNVAIPWGQDTLENTATVLGAAEGVPDLGIALVEIPEDVSALVGLTNVIVNQPSPDNVNPVNLLEESEAFIKLIGQGLGIIPCPANESGQAAPPN